MSNSPDKAAEWVSFLSSQPVVPFGNALRKHFATGHITRLCDCGCNSFDFEIPDGIVLEPLVGEGGNAGKFFEVVFASDAGAEVAFLFFSDSRGYLAGLDVTCGGSNHGPVPEGVKLGSVAYVV